jgi:hypothetical protein
VAWAGAELLGLSGKVEQQEFFRLADNIHPLTGERLTLRNKADAEHSPM